MVGQKRKDIINLLVVVAGLVLLNWLSALFYFRLDLTAEKRYTLSPVSEEVLADLEAPVVITVYLEGDFPAAFKRLRNSTYDFLADVKSVSGGKVQFNFVNPMDGDAETQQRSLDFLIERGIEPTNLNVKTDDGLSQKMIFPAALINYKDISVPVRLLQTRQGQGYDEVLNNSIENLEYTFISAIRKVTLGGMPRIGFTEGHDELSDLELSSAMRSLSDFYEVGRVDLNTINFPGLEELDLLVIAKPRKSFSEAEKYKIDHYLINGGRILWSLDQVNADLDSLRGAGEQIAYANNLNLDDLLFKYGIRLNYDLLSDMNSAQIPVTLANPAGQPQIQLVPWLFYPIFVPFSEHPMVKNLEGIRSEFPGTIDLIQVEGVKAEIILQSSPFNKVLKVPVSLTLKMLEAEPDPAQFQSNPKITGAILEGNFPSVFENRPIPSGINGKPSGSRKPKPGRMIVLADGDIFKNQVNGADGSPFPLGYDRFTREQYGNNNLLLNAADMLIDDSGLIRLRGREITLRLLDRPKIKENKTFWQVLNFAVPLLVLIVLGIFQHYFRRAKYAR